MDRRALSYRLRLWNQACWFQLSVLSPFALFDLIANNEPQRANKTAGFCFVNYRNLYPDQLASRSIDRKKPLSLLGGRVKETLNILQRKTRSLTRGKRRTKYAVRVGKKTRCFRAINTLPIVRGWHLNARPS